MTLPSARELAARFPADFRLGVSTASYQIEGAVTEDGRGPSIWDTFCHEPGHVVDGETGDVAIDHYHRVTEDVGHIAGSGARDYRFSIAWPRVMPSGRGPVNQAGLDFYDRLVDGLLAHGVRPVPTLYHWDLPQGIQDAGGWMNRDTAAALADYAQAVAQRLGDRVTSWITLNEMNVHTLYGYALDAHAPGLGLGLGAIEAGHTMMVAHGLAVAALRASGAREVGVATAHFPVDPASPAPDDVAAARLYADLTNWTFSDPLLRGTYPEAVRPLVGLSDGALAEDLAVISAPLDFYGVNYYNPERVGARREGVDYGQAGEVAIPAEFPFVPVDYGAAERTDFGWPVVPEGFARILTHLAARYPKLPPIIVTENGADYHDRPAPDGAVHDPARIAYLAAHLGALADARDAGVDVAGYYVWSIFDNFEWAAGYRERFGLVYVDYATLERTRKDSWHWYREFAEALGERARAGQGSAGAVGSAGGAVR